MCSFKCSFKYSIKVLVWVTPCTTMEACLTAVAWQVGELRYVNMSAFVTDCINSRYRYFSNSSLTYTAYIFEIE